MGSSGVDMWDSDSRLIFSSARRGSEPMSTVHSRLVGVVGAWLDGSDGNGMPGAWLGGRRDLEGRSRFYV